MPEKTEITKIWRYNEKKEFNALGIGTNIKLTKKRIAKKIGFEKVM